MRTPYDTAQLLKRVQAELLATGHALAALSVDSWTFERDYAILVANWRVYQRLDRYLKAELKLNLSVAA